MTPSSAAPARPGAASPSSPHNDASVSDLPAQGRAAVRGGIWGNFVDQIDIFLPVTALAPALPVIAGKTAVAQSAAFVVMATLIGRPLGAMIFGRIADRLGRTATTKVAIAGTATTTLLIAAVPTHAVLGVGTIAAIITLRFLGGIFLAGEYSAAIPLAMEWSAPRRRGLWSGAIMSMAPWAQATIAFVTALQLSTLGLARYAAWGWRASFLAGGLASLGMLWFYSRRVADAPIPHKAPVSTAQPQAHLREVLIGRYRGAFWQMFGLMSGLWLMTQMTVIVLTARLVSDAKFSNTQASIAMGLASVGQAIMMTLAGHLSTLLGRRRLLVGWGLLALVAGPALWWFTLHQHALAGAALGAIALQVTTVAAYGPIGAYLTERFPAWVRSTGYGTAYSLSIIIPALYPYYLPLLERGLGRLGAPIFLIGLGAILVAACAAIGPRLGPDEIDDDVEAVASRQAVSR